MSVRRTEPSPGRVPEVATLPPAPVALTLSGAGQVLALQQTAGNVAVVRALAGRRLARVDQHAGTHTPTVGELGTIQSEINPTTATTSTGAMADWDGINTNPDWQTNRNALKLELTAALDAMLARAMPGIEATRAGRAVDVATFEGTGRLAKQLTDAQFGSLVQAAALTAPQVHEHQSFNYTAGTNLLDRTDPSVYRTDPMDLAGWMTQTDTTARDAQRAHNFNKDRPGSDVESKWLNDHVLVPFVGREEVRLRRFDRFGFAMSEPGRVQIVPRIVGSAAFPDTPGAAGAPSMAERRAHWSRLKIMVHEYVHTLEHPSFIAARGGNRVLFEGFCEMFTKEVMVPAIPLAKGGDSAMRIAVEGADPNGTPWPDFTPDLVPDYSPGSYADYLLHAENIRAALGAAGGENAVRAAFFQGHVELIGLQPSGAMAAAPTNADDSVEVPAGITTLAAFAVLTGVPEAELRGANSGLAGDAVTPGTRLVAPGCRYHTVVAASGPAATGPRPRPTLTVAESKDQIATQNGVTPVALELANPQVADWATLAAGDRVLIPRHP